MIKLYQYKNIAILLSIIFLTACTFAGQTKSLFLERLTPDQYPHFSDYWYYDNLEHSIQKSISYLQRIPQDRLFSFDQDKYDAAHLIRSFEIFSEFIKTRPSGSELRDFIAANYQVYRSVGNKSSGKVMFTGYYEPFLQGSRNKSKAYPYPVYKIPDDLVTIDLGKFDSSLQGKRITGRHTGQTIIPYYTRKEITGMPDFKKTAQPLAYVDNQIDLFFLQIQGSGKIFLDNGEIINVHYHCSNGGPYRSIGRLLIKEGKIPRSQMSMQSIRKYLKDNPGETDRILNYNPSYVFFKIEEKGPLGYLSVQLTPGRSLATDRRIFPLAALSYLKTSIPLIDGDQKIHEWENFSGFFMNQDTGGAIKGAGRADLFFGSGPYAKTAAGHLQHNGQLYFLVLK